MAWGCYILDEQQQPVPEPSLVQWCLWMDQHADQLQLAIDAVAGVRISTVFLGMDHGYTPQQPVLWETMIFGGPLDRQQVRYTSQAEALVGHQEAVWRVRHHPLGDAARRLRLQPH